MSYKSSPSVTVGLMPIVDSLVFFHLVHPVPVVLTQQNSVSNFIIKSVDVSVFVDLTA